MRKRRILIAGAHGFVGARAMWHFPGAVVVPGELLRECGESLSDYIKEQQPEFILNVAAISDIGICEKNPEASYRANVLFPVLLAKAARETGAKLISFSSDQVYTGCAGEGPYSESEELPVPANVYARHKLEAEKRVLDLLPESVMLRVTWMYDMPMYSVGMSADNANRGNFLLNTVKSVLRGQDITASSEEHRGITYVRQVIRFLDQVFTLPGGVYNYGSENSLNMYETAKALLDALKLNGSVRDTERMRHNLWMDAGKIRRHGIVFDTTAEGFRRCVQDYGLDRIL